MPFKNHSNESKLRFVKLSLDLAAAGSSRILAVESFGKAVIKAAFQHHFVLPNCPECTTIQEWLDSASDLACLSARLGKVEVKRKKATKVKSADAEDSVIVLSMAPQEKRKELKDKVKV